MNLPTAAVVIVAGLAALWPAQRPLTFDERFAPAKVFMEPATPVHPVHTFEERWEPVNRMPQMLLPDVQEEKGELAPRVIPVRTIPIRREDVVPAVHVVSVQSSGEGADKAVGGARPTGEARAKTETRGMNRALSAALDICQRHNMRKVHYGRTWRCRR